MSRPLTTVVALASLLILAAVPRAPAQQPAAGAPPAVAPEAEALKDPSVIALLETKPSSPRDLFRVVGILVEMGYPKTARPLLVKLSETGTDEGQLAEIGRTFGRTAVDHLAAAPADLQPEAKQVADRILTATRNQARDPQRIAQLIELLKDPSYDARINAMTSLRAGEDASVDALVTVLVDPAREAEHAQVRTALAAMDHYAVGPLAALAEAPDEAVRISALKAAALFTDPDSIAPLYAAAFAPGQTPAVRQTAVAALEYRLKKMPRPAEAAAELYVTARTIYLKHPAEANFDPASAPTSGVVWKWDTAARRPVAVPGLPSVGELDRASRLARTAFEIFEQGGYARTLAWAARLESAIIVAGPKAQDRTVAASAWSADVKPSAADLEGLLDFVLESDHMFAAAETVRLLAAVGGKQALVSRVAGKPSPLVKAATHADGGVRFAAVDSILALNPTEPFTGSSGVFDAVGYFAGSIGARKVLVVDPNQSRARNVGSLLAGLDLRPETAGSARDAVRILSQDPDFEFVFVARPLLAPQSGALVAQLRGDYRTRRLPVVVYCGPDEVEFARTIVAGDQYAAAIYEPRTLEELTRQLEGSSGLHHLRHKARVAADERAAQAASIVAAAVRLMAAGNSPFNLRPYEARLTTAVLHPGAGKQLAALLGKFGSATAQRTLADVASSAALPLEQRQAASQAFCDSVIRFGTLLTTVEVRRQYERYNAAETLDRPTQELLAAILDVMEARAAKLPGATARAATPPTVEATAP